MAARGRPHTFRAAYALNGATRTSWFFFFRQRRSGISQIRLSQTRRSEISQIRHKGSPPRLWRGAGEVPSGSEGLLLAAMRLCAELRHLFKRISVIIIITMRCGRGHVSRPRRIPSQIPAQRGYLDGKSLQGLTKLKVYVHFSRLPLYALYCVQNPSNYERILTRFTNNNVGI